MRVPLVENYPVTSVFALGAQIEDSSEFVRITFWDDTNGPQEHVVVTRIVMPLGAYHHMVKEMFGAQKNLS